MPEARGKHFVHESLILGMDGHSLVKMTHMLYGVGPSIVDGERRLGKAVWELFFLIRCVKDDLEIWRKALLIASFPPYSQGVSSCFFSSDVSPHQLGRRTSRNTH